jgi:hypothetical protein
MTEPRWKLISDNVVWRKWPDGRQDSCSVNAEEYQLWLQAGNTPLPVDPPTPEQLKAAIDTSQAAIQAAGFTCSNGIKLQVREHDLVRWNQLATSIIAFSPPSVLIRDFDNENHVVTREVALQMLGEVAGWFQTFLSETWSLKDAIQS